MWTDVILIWMDGITILVKLVKIRYLSSSLLLLLLFFILSFFIINRRPPPNQNILTDMKTLFLILQMIY